jgi:predicted N-acetyltransferase YhbS
MNAAIGRLLRSLTDGIRWVRRHCVHVIVASPDGRMAFGMVGLTRWRLRYARHLWPEQHGFRVRFRPHRPNWVPAARRLVRQHGLVVVTATPLPAILSDEALRLPNWIPLRIDLRESEEVLRAALSASARKDLAKIRGKGFTVELTRDPSFVEEFHRRYHQPSIAGRHGEDGFVMTVEEIRQLLAERGGEFLCVHQGGRRVGALLNETNGPHYKLGRIGWLDGDPAWTQKGVTAAMYWYAMQRARQSGFRYVQLGGTPPYIEHGVFQFKSKWCAEWDPDESTFGEHFLLLDPSHDQVRALLARHSIVGLTVKRELFVLTGRDPAIVSLSPTTARSIAFWYQLRETPRSDVFDDDERLPPSLRAWFSLVERVSST